MANKTRPKGQTEALIGASPEYRLARLTDAFLRRVRVRAWKTVNGKKVKTYDWIKEAPTANSGVWGYGGDSIRVKLSGEWWPSSHCELFSDGGGSQLLHETEELQALRAKYPSADRHRHALPTHETIYELGHRVIFDDCVDRAEQERVASILRKYFPPRIDSVIVSRRVIKKPRVSKPSTASVARQETLW